MYIRVRVRAQELQRVVPHPSADPKPWRAASAVALGSGSNRLPSRLAVHEEAARLRASGHAHVHHAIAHVARATTRRLDGVKAPLTVVGDAYKNNVLRFRNFWRRDPAAPALCLDDPQALLVIRRP